MTLTDWDIQIGVADAGGSMGTVDLLKTGWAATSSEMKAAILMMGHGDTIDTEQSGCGMCIGMTDGSTDYFTSVVTSDNSGDTLFSRGGSGRLLALMDQSAADGSIEGSATFDSWQNTGMRISVDTAWAASKPMAAIMFAGALQVDIRKFTFSDNPESVNIGFEPELIFLMGQLQDTMDDTANPQHWITFGAAAKSRGITTQGCIAHNSEWDLRGVEVNPLPHNTAIAYNTKIGAALFDDAVIEELTASFTSTGYGIASATGPNEMVVMALRGLYKPIDATVSVVTPGPASSTTALKDGPVSPFARILGGVYCSAANTIRTNRVAGAFGVGMCTATDERYFGFREDEPSSGTVTNNASLSASNAFDQNAYSLIGGSLGTDGGSPAFAYDSRSLTWGAKAALCNTMLDISIGKGPACRVLGGRALGGRIL